MLARGQRSRREAGMLALLRNSLTARGTARIASRGRHLTTDLMASQLAMRPGDFDMRHLIVLTLGSIAEKG